MFPVLAVGAAVLLSRLTKREERGGGLAGPPAGMKVKKDPDFDYNGEWIVTYAGQTYRIYFDRSIANAWLFKYAPGVMSKRHGEDLVSPHLGSKAEALVDLQRRIDEGDPRLAMFRQPR